MNIAAHFAPRRAISKMRDLSLAQIEELAFVESERDRLYRVLGPKPTADETEELLQQRLARTEGAAARWVPAALLILYIVVCTALAAYIARGRAWL